MEADTISGQRYDDDAGARGGGDGVDALFGRRVRLLRACRVHIGTTVTQRRFTTPP